MLAKYLFKEIKYFYQCTANLGVLFFFKRQCGRRVPYKNTPTIRIHQQQHKSTKMSVKNTYKHNQDAGEKDSEYEELGEKMELKLNSICIWTT